MLWYVLLISFALLTPFSSSLSVLKTDDFLWICVQCPEPPACVAGTYSDSGKNRAGDGACQPCPAGTFSSVGSSSSVSSSSFVTVLCVFVCAPMCTVRQWWSVYVNSLPPSLPIFLSFSLSLSYAVLPPFPALKTDTHICVCMHTLTPRAACIVRICNVMHTHSCVFLYLKITTPTCLFVFLCECVCVCVHIWISVNYFERISLSFTYMRKMYWRVYIRW